MIRIMLCCGGGFSSSAMATKIKKELHNLKLDDRFTIDFEQFVLSKESLENYDVIVCCPHLARDVKEYNEKYIQNRIPIYVIPPLQYGVVTADILTEDVEDVIAGFKDNPVNPFHFPGEENIYQSKRKLSWRRAHPDQKAK